MITFENSHYLFLLLMDIPFVLIFYFIYLKGIKELKVIGGDFRFNSLKKAYFIKSFLAGIFFILFFSLTVFSLAGVHWGERVIQQKRKGYQVVYLLDVSKSMLAKDVLPSRMGLAIEFIKIVTERVEDGLFGLVLFAGDAVKVIPQTDDKFSIHLFLRKLNDVENLKPGSNMEQGLAVAKEMFEKDENRKGMIILLSDGENRNGNPLKEAKLLSRHGIPVIAVMVGTEKGAKIPIDKSEYLKDRNGRFVISHASPTVLTEIASVSDGAYFSLDNAGKIGSIYSDIFVSAKKISLKYGFEVESIDRSSVVLVLGLLSLIVSMSIWRIKIGKEL